MFIVFEGIDGSGKSTQAKLLTHLFEKNGHKVWLTAEPTQGQYGKEARKIISSNESYDFWELVNLFIKDREEHQKEIRAKIAQGYTVVCDRYKYSTYAYQGVLCEDRGVAVQGFRMELDEKHKNMLEPDLIFYLKLESDIAIKRIQDRGEPTYREHFLFLEKVYVEFLDLFWGCGSPHFKNLPIVLLDAKKSQKTIAKTIKQIVRNYEQA